MSMNLQPTVAKERVRGGLVGRRVNNIDHLLEAFHILSNLYSKDPA